MNTWNFNSILLCNCLFEPWKGLCCCLWFKQTSIDFPFPMMDDLRSRNRSFAIFLKQSFAIFFEAVLRYFKCIWKSWAPDFVNQGSCSIIPWCLCGWRTCTNLKADLLEVSLSRRHPPTPARVFILSPCSAEGSRLCSFWTRDGLRPFRPSRGIPAEA